MSDVSSDLRPLRQLSRTNAVLAALFFCLWLFPVFYVGFFKKSFPYYGVVRRFGIQPDAAFEASKYMNNLYRIACLFIYRENDWSNYYFQVQLKGGEHWIEVDESILSIMNSTGYDTRLPRILRFVAAPDSGLALQKSLAEFVQDRYGKVNPEAPEVVSVRAVRVRYDSGSEELAMPEGHWTKPPLETITDREHQIVFSHSLNEEKGQ